MVLVSVIVPVYDVEKYIKECLDSIISQNVSDVEIIVVNDGSTDNSGDIIDIYRAKYSRIKIIHQNNQGVSVARNTGLKKATGKWVFFVDGDDSIPKNAISKLLKFAEASDCDICIGDYCLIREDKTNEMNQNSFFGHVNNPKTDYKSLIINCLVGNEEKDNVTCVGVPWAKLYRRDFLENSGIEFLPGVKRNQDVLFNMYCFAETDRIEYCPELVYRYRIWENSAVNRYSPDCLINGERTLNLFNNFLKTHYSDTEIWTAYEKRSLFIYYEILDKQIFNTENKQSVIEKYKDYKRLQTSKWLSLMSRHRIQYSKCLYVDRWLCTHRLFFVSYVIRATKRFLGGNKGK